MKAFNIFIFFGIFGYIFGDEFNGPYGLHKNSIEETFRYFNLIPNTVSVAPTTYLPVMFITREEIGLSYDIGEPLHTSIFQMEPFFKWRLNTTIYATFVIFDADGYCNEDRLLFLWYNINKKEGKDVKIKYVPPVEFKPIHRIVYLLFEHENVLNPLLVSERFEDRDSRSLRHFDLKKFIHEFGLGNPVAGNIYRCDFQASKPIIPVYMILFLYVSTMVGAYHVLRFFCEKQPTM